MAKTSKKIKDNLVHYAIYTIIGFILLSSALSFWNRYVTYDTRSIIEKTERTKMLVKGIREDLIKNINLSVNAYVNSGNENTLAPFNQVVAVKDSVFSQLESHLKDQGFEPMKLTAVKTAFNNYTREAKVIIDSVKNGKTVGAIEMLKRFEFPADQQYHDFAGEVFQYENEIEALAKSDYDWSIADNAIIQIILIILSDPNLVIASKRLGNEVRNNQKLLSDLDNNNRKYLYNDGAILDMNANDVVEKSISSFKKACDFVENVSKGKYDHAQSLLPHEVRSLNQSTLMGALLQMGTKLQTAEGDDRKRQWASNGLNQFYEIVRNNQNDLKGLADQSVAFLTKYLRSQQGSLFTVSENDDEEYLELIACYAFDRKKWIQKRIDIGTGLVGQAYLDGEPVMFTQIPNGYTSITSGLGDATPSCLLIVPFRFNDKVEAIFEVATFLKYEEHHVEFLKKAGAFLASALQAAKNNNKMQAG